MQEIFKIYGWKVISCEPIHQGLINSTYSIQTTTGNFILQSINHHVFKSPKAIDDNINTISTYLHSHNPKYLFTHLKMKLSKKFLGATYSWCPLKLLSLSD